MADEQMRDVEAPHGRDEDGTPLAPYGYKVDGTPRLSNRGRSSAGGGGPAPKKHTPKKTGSGRSAADAKAALIGLADAITTPALAAVTNPAVARRIGEEKASGLAGSLVIVDSFVPHYADWLITTSQTRPGILGFLDTMEEKAPLITGVVLTAQLVKAIVGNMAHPDPRLAEAAKLKAAMRAAQMAEEIEREAARMGVTVEPTVMAGAGA